MKNQTKSRLSIILQLEGLAVFIWALAAYYSLAGSWWLFGLLILAPDLAMVGYLANKEIGAMCYNLIHWYVLPGSLLGLGLWLGSDLPVHIALIWLAHIGIDRAIGYGLKYPSDFKDTHLQRV